MLKEKSPLNPSTLRITLQSVKTLATSDGHAMTCKVLFDGVHVANAEDGGFGGPTDFWPLAGKEESYRAAKAYVDTLPLAISEYFPEGLQRTLEIVVSEIIDWQQAVKSIKRHWKKNICFQSYPNGESAEFLPLETYQVASRWNATEEIMKKHWTDIEAKKGNTVVFADTLF